MKNQENNQDDSNLLATERHYTTRELSERWGFGEKTIIRIFENEPGVIIYERKGTSYRRRYRSIRIPESIAMTVHARLHRR